jgi:hypothetical protein
VEDHGPKKNKKIENIFDFVEHWTAVIHGWRALVRCPDFSDDFETTTTLSATTTTIAIENAVVT